MIDRNHIIAIIVFMIFIFCAIGTSLFGDADDVQTVEHEEISVIPEDVGGMSENMEEDAGAKEDRDAREILADLIEDKIFRECVWRDAGIRKEDSEEIILQKLDQCERLALDKSDKENTLYTLEYLPLLPNLKSLTIILNEWNHCEIEDFTPIAELSRLEELYIEFDDEREINLSFLANMKTVTELYLPNSRVKDIVFLGEMPQLERLSLYETPVDDLAVLEKLPKLEELSLAGNAGAENIEVVGKLSGLKDLGLQRCGITDINFLSGLTELQSVNLNENAIVDLEPLSGLGKLERLGAAENRIRDISLIAGLPNLYDLALDGNEISDISALGSLSHLNKVGLSDNRISDISPLAGKQELLYVDMAGNPCTDLRSVLDVPFLSFGNSEVVTERQAEQVKSWMKKEHPETSEYECIDYMEGDLNGDGITDAAVVLNGVFEDKIEGFDNSVYEDTRRLYIFFQQGDGSWQEFTVMHLPGENSGGMRGNSYLGIFMGDGCLITESGGGSAEGSTNREVYLYQEGELKLATERTARDYRFYSGYDVVVRDREKDRWIRYAVAWENDRMVRVDIEDSEHPSHKAFPNLDISDMSYIVHNEKTETSISPVEALSIFCDHMAVEAEHVNLPYASWQKEGYELLIGAELPDYYYVVPGTERAASKEETDEDSDQVWDGDYIYYSGLTDMDGAICHEIYYITREDKKLYLLNDDTGEIQEE